MKTLLLGFLLVSTVVSAKPYLVYHYSANTRVVMTNESCLVEGLEGHRAVVQASDGRYIQGCWRLVDADQNARIDWNNPSAPGDFSVLPFHWFKIEDDGR
jgi:hypothetical protein